MSEILTTCNTNCKYYSNYRCLKPNGLVCPPISISTSFDGTGTITFDKEHIYTTKLQAIKNFDYRDMLEKEATNDKDMSTMWKRV